MKKILNNPYLSLAARLLVAFVFIYAAIGKIVDPQTFSKEISNYGILPFFVINLSALILPWLELFSGILLLAGISIKTNALIIGGLLFVFIVAVAIAMAKGLNINCGCFSHRIVYIGWKKIFENTGLFICCAYIFFFPVKKFTLERFILRSQE